MKTTLLCCIGTDLHISNPNLLYHFLDYYIALGITDWALTLHTGPRPELRNLATYEWILSLYDIPYDVWIGPFDTFERETRHNAFVDAQENDAWVIGVDLDEFVAFPGAIPQYLQGIAELGYNCLGGRLVDRVASDGTLKHIMREPSLYEQFPIAAEVKRNIYKPATPKAPYEKKIAIMKPLQWGLGHHFIDRSTRMFQREAPDNLEINHYAWDDLLISRIQQRLGDPWAEEYRSMIHYIAQHGRIRLQDVGVK
jgi:hypothetical protein